MISYCASVQYLESGTGKQLVVSTEAVDGEIVVDGDR